MVVHATETEKSTGIQLAHSLLADAGRLMREARPVESALAIARAFEVALAASTCAVLLSVADANRRATAAEVEMLRKRYMLTIGSMSVPALRNVVIALVTREVFPRTIAESLDFVEQAKRIASILPAREHFASIRDANARATMEELRDAPILAMAGKILHQHYVPAPREVEEQRNAVAKLLHGLTAIFGLSSEIGPPHDRA